MDVKEMRLTAQNMISRQIDPVFAIKMINRAQQHIIPNRYPETRIIEDDGITATYELKENEWSFLLPTVVSVLKIKYLDKDGFVPISNFEISNNKIKVTKSGTYMLETLSLPKAIEVETDSPQIQDIFHGAIPSYLAAMELHRIFGSEDGDYVHYLQEFERLCEEAHSVLNKTESKRLAIEHLQG